MAIIALSSAAVMVFQFGRPFGEAVSLSLALMCTMILVHLLIGRSRDRSAVSDAVERLEERMTDLDEDVGNLEGRLTGMEHSMPRRTRAEIDPLFAEVEVLGTLVKQMAEAMSDLETKVEDQQAIAPPPPVQSLPQYPQTPQPSPGFAPAHGQNQNYQDPYSRAPAPAAPPQHPFAPPPQPGPYNEGAVPTHRDMSELDRRYGVHVPRDGQPPMPAADISAGGEEFAELPADPQVSRLEQPGPDAAMNELIMSALNANRVELYLQPIVSLPQRQVKHYEAFTRLRNANGDSIEARAFLPEAVRSGQIARIDNLLLFRSVQVIRRLMSRNKNAILFCNISSQSLSDETFFPGFLEFVRTHKEFSGALVFEFSQADIAGMSTADFDRMSALYDAGFRFSVDQIDDMKMDFNSLAGHGFRYGKLNADYLIGRRETNHGHIHPADFGDLLHRYGMELITDHVETESQVLELLDFDIKLAQGNLFSPPRPVRAEVLQGTPAPRKKAAG
ncbi:EAL domain-containing protein [Labrenzia sp. PHM005]|uniref:EAL domain-containing protein n=1 Tax=Labrenzia sp. PHM005 TaxID=2590016 RepID=UPI0011401748|nr:EAL domain-containing protein [Labrenzia sp. PHM005]QDG79177.1 EAL domain-containing protein [Labrenzia sp. PHM005]